VGFKIEKQFSWQLFFWKWLQRRKLAKPVERLEYLIRRTPGLERLIRHDGIQYFALLRKLA
jgi:hypothetical protein